ncbi:MAG: hypothetical protein ABMA13_10555 [Chthoniobacteraceae bacterium]
MITFPSLQSRQIFAACFAFCIAGIAVAQTPLAPPVKPTVSGKFIGNGKNAAIKFVTAGEREAFSGKEAISLIFTEKDPAKAEKPSFDAMFGRLGSALILSVHHDGGIFGCEVNHSAHQKQGFSALGEIKMVEFKIAGGNVSGRVSTGKELDAFGEKWEVDLTFAAPLPPALRNAPAPAPKPVANEAGEPAKNARRAPAGPVVAARKLPLPKDATDVEFKATVNQIQFNCGRPVEAVTKEFAANLKQQGWKDCAGSLMGKTNAILRREQGDAKLTIMIQPAGAGSVVKVFTDGLDWSGASDTTPPPPRKSPEATANEIEAQAQKLIQDALKRLPK